jgi:hypothetical protein
MGLLDILKQYSNPGTVPTGDVSGHFESVAQQVNPSALGGGIAAALRSDATPAFGQAIGSLFGQSNPQQKAGVLNELVQVLGSAGIASAGGGILTRILGSSAAPSGSAAPITPAQAAQVSPSDVTAIAASAQQHDDSIVDRVGAFYAQHPTLVKTLGVAALGAVMSHMSQQQKI